MINFLTTLYLIVCVLMLATMFEGGGLFFLFEIVHLVIGYTVYCSIRRINKPSFWTAWMISSWIIFPFIPLSAFVLGPASLLLLPLLRFLILYLYVDFLSDEASEDIPKHRKAMDTATQREAAWQALKSSGIVILFLFAIATYYVITD